MVAGTLLAQVVRLVLAALSRRGLPWSGPIAAARRGLLLVATIVSCAVMYVASTRLARIMKIDMTDSMPLGVYFSCAASIDPQRIVVARPPAAASRVGLENGYLAIGSCASGAAPVLKICHGDRRQ